WGIWGAERAAESGPRLRRGGGNEGNMGARTTAKHRAWIENGDPAGLRAILLGGIERSLKAGRLDGPKRSTARFRKKFAAIITNIGMDSALSAADRARCLRILAGMQAAVRKPDPAKA